MGHKEQGERTEDFSKVYQEMDIEDQEKIALTANKLLIAQKIIKEDKSLNIKDEENPV